MSREALLGIRAAQVRALDLTDALLASLTPAPPAVTPPAVAPPAATTKPLAWAGQLARQLGSVERAKVFCDRVRWICEDLDIGPAPGKPEPNWPMTWMAFETGRTFSPKVKNPGSSGTGLIQFMDDTAVNDLKTTLAHLRSLSAEDQLNFVWKYLRNRIRERGPIRRLSDGYLSILMPAYMDDEESAVIWLKSKHKAFAVNAGLDTNKDGSITKAEVAAVIYKMLAEGLKPENAG